MDHAPSRDVLSELARLADDVGPALAPAGQRQLLRSITEAARALFEAAACSVAILDEEQRELVFTVATGAGATCVEGLRMPAGRGVAGWVVTSRQAIAIENVRDDPRFASDVAETTGYVPQSIVAMPLESDEAVLGVISVLDRRADAVGRPGDMELLALFARQAALAIEASQVFTHIGRSLLQLLASAASAGDPDLAAALDRAAATTTGPTGELLQLASCFRDLRAMGPEECRAALDLLTGFVHYARARAMTR